MKTEIATRDEALHKENDISKKRRIRRKEALS